MIINTYTQSDIYYLVSKSVYNYKEVLIKEKC